MDKPITPGTPFRVAFVALVGDDGKVRQFPVNPVRVVHPQESGRVRLTIDVIGDRAYLADR